MISLYNDIDRYDKSYIMDIVIELFASVENKYFEQFYPRIKKKQGQIEVAITVIRARRIGNSYKF